jgi:hypothetical protein
MDTAQRQLIAQGFVDLANLIAAAFGDLWMDRRTQTYKALDMMQFSRAAALVIVT